MSTRVRTIGGFVIAYGLIGLVIFIASQTPIFTRQEIYAPACLPDQDCALVELAARDVLTPWFYIFALVLLLTPIIIYLIKRRHKK